MQNSAHACRAACPQSGDREIRTWVCAFLRVPRQLHTRLRAKALINMTARFKLRTIFRSLTQPFYYVFLIAVDGYNPISKKSTEKPNTFCISGMDILHEYLN